MTRWLYYYNIFGLLQLWQFAEQYKNAKVGTKVCQILNKPYTKLLENFKKIAKVAKFRRIWSYWNSDDVRKRRKSVKNSKKKTIFWILSKNIWIFFTWRRRVFKIFTFLRKLTKFENSIKIFVAFLARNIFAFRSKFYSVKSEQSFKQTLMCEKC